MISGGCEAVGEPFGILKKEGSRINLAGEEFLRHKLEFIGRKKDSLNLFYGIGWINNCDARAHIVNNWLVLARLHESAKIIIN